MCDRTHQPCAPCKTWRPASGSESSHYIGYCTGDQEFAQPSESPGPLPVGASCQPVVSLPYGKQEPAEGCQCNLQAPQTMARRGWTDRPRTMWVGAADISLLVRRPMLPQGPVCRQCSRYCLRVCRVLGRATNECQVLDTKLGHPSCSHRRKLAPVISVSHTASPQHSEAAICSSGVFAMQVENLRLDSCYCFMNRGVDEEGERSDGMARLTRECLDTVGHFTRPSRPTRKTNTGAHRWRSGYEESRSSCLHEREMCRPHSGVARCWR